MTSSVPYLSAAIWIPILAGLLLLAFGRDRHPGMVRVFALAAAVLGFLVVRNSGVIHSRTLLRCVDCNRDTLPSVESSKIRKCLYLEGEFSYVRKVERVLSSSLKVVRMNLPFLSGV